MFSAINGTSLLSNLKKAQKTSAIKKKHTHTHRQTFTFKMSQETPFAHQLHEFFH